VALALLVWFKVVLIITVVVLKQRYHNGPVMNISADGWIAALKKIYTWILLRCMVNIKYWQQM
jgi:hypothetical protein